MKSILLFVALILSTTTFAEEIICYKTDGYVLCNNKNIIINLYEVGPIQYSMEPYSEVGLFNFDYNKFEKQRKIRLCGLYINNVPIEFPFGIIEFPNVSTVGGIISFEAIFFCSSFKKLKNIDFMNNDKTIRNTSLGFDNSTSKLNVQLPPGCGQIKIFEGSSSILNISYKMPTIGIPENDNGFFYLKGSNLFDSKIEIFSILPPDVNNSIRDGELSDDHTSVKFSFPENQFQGSYKINFIICKISQQPYFIDFEAVLFNQNTVIPDSGGLITFSGKNLKVRFNATAKFNNKETECLKTTSTFSTIQCHIKPRGNENGYNIPFIITFDGKHSTNEIKISYDLPLINKVVQKSLPNNVFDVTGVHFNQISTVEIKVNGTSMLLNNKTQGYFYEYISNSSLSVTIPFNTQPGYMSLGLSDSSFFSPGYNVKIKPTVSTLKLSSKTDGEYVYINGTFLRTVDYYKTPIPLTIGGYTVDGRHTRCTNFVDGDGYSFQCLMQEGIGKDYTLQVEYDNQNVGTISFSYDPPNIREYQQQSDGSIKIGGTNLGNDPKASSVKMISSDQKIIKYATVFASKHTYMSFEVPDGAPNSGTIHFNVILDNVKDLQYTLAPVISNVTSIPCSGGNVTINGHYFYGYEAESTKVTIGKLNCTVEQVSLNSIKCEIKPSTKGQSPYTSSGLNREIVIKGPNTLEVVNTGFPILFNYLPPSISSYSNISTDLILTIFGNSFSDSNLFVSINDTECKFPSIVGFIITCKISEESRVFNNLGGYHLTISVDGQSTTLDNFTYFFLPPIEIGQPSTELFPPVVYIGIAIFALFLVFIYFQVHVEIIKYRKGKRAKKLFEASEAKRLLMRNKFENKIKYKFVPQKVEKPKSKVVKFLKKRPFLKRLFKKSFEEPLEDVNINNVVNQTENTTN